MVMGKRGLGDQEGQTIPGAGPSHYIRVVPVSQQEKGLKCLLEGFLQHPKHNPESSWHPSPSPDS